jgi:hypothetical protein
MTKNLLSKIAGGVVIASLAAGCGSRHSDDAGPAQQQEDAAASGSVAGLIGFAQVQIARTDDASEPRSLAGVNPPVSEVDEPVAI